MKKGRHRRFEEARALKRSTDVDFDRLLEDLQKDSSPGDPGGDDRLEDDEDDEDDDRD